VDSRNFPGTMLLPMAVSIAIVVVTVFVIAPIMIFVSWWRGTTLESVPLLICGITMLITGLVSLFVTQWARKRNKFIAVSGLIGVTSIMIVPLIVVAVLHFIVEKSVAHLAFSYFVVYYLMFLPVGTWLILPPKSPDGKNKMDGDDNQSSI